MKHFISIFKSCKSSQQPIGKMEIWEWLSGEYVALIELVDKIRSTSDQSEAKRLKSEALPVASISGTFKNRNREGLKQHSGLICIDIDGNDNVGADMSEFKARLAQKDYIMYCGLSVRGKGLLCIVKIGDVDNHKGHFYALQKEFEDMGITIDKSCSDVTRVRIFSYDNDAYCNRDSVVYCDVLTKSGTSKVKDSSPKPQRVYTQSQPEVEPEPKPVVNFNELTIMERLKLIRDSFKNQNSADMFPPPSNKQKITAVLEYVREHKVDITETYDDWLVICCIVKNVYWEEGREMFHQISQFYDGYTYEEADDFFTKANPERYHPKTDKILEIAASYDIHIEL